MQVQRDAIAGAPRHGPACAGDREDLAEGGGRGVQLVDVAGDQAHPDHNATVAAAALERRASFVVSQPGSVAMGRSGRPRTSGR